MGDGKVKLAWHSEDEINTSQFVIERSTDGVLFEPEGSVPAAGSGRNHYIFTDIILNIPATYYYRLKMVDMDGRYKYSSIVRINNAADIKLAVFPNPAAEFITIVSSRKQEVIITNTASQTIKHLLLIKGSQAINISSYAPGVYFIKSDQGVIKFIKK